VRHCAGSGADKPDLEKVGASLEQIVTASHRAADIVTSIRAMFRKDRSEQLPVDINELIQIVLAIVRIDLQKNGVEVRRWFDEQLPIVQGDKVQLQQVVLNLVMNAVEAMLSVQSRVLNGTNRPIQTRHGKGVDPGYWCRSPTIRP
jgi:C4-dicarboxylate-specific signal transduction histidine kinase